MKGSLKLHPLPVLLTELSEDGKTGILTITRAEIRKQTCLVRGAIRYAASNIQAERLTEFLRRSGSISDAMWEQIEPMLQQGVRLGPAILESGALDPDQLRAVVRRHILDLLLPCFDWIDGNFLFDEGVPDITGAVNVVISPLELSLERARRRENRVGLTELSSNRSLRIARVRGTAEQLEALDLTPIERAVLSDIDGAATAVSQLLSLSEAEEEEVLHALQTLLAVGALRKAQVREVKIAGGAGTETMVPMAVSEADKKRLERYMELYRNSEHASHYQLLGVNQAANEAEIRQGYYDLARDVHPDRFGSPPMNIIRNEMEILFAKITEAYNTLVDREAREEYDRSWSKPTTASAPLTAEQTQKPAEMARLNFQRGRKLLAQGKPQEAYKFLVNAVSLDGTRAEHHMLLGKVQALNPRYRKDALISLLKSIELDPTRPTAHVELGRLYRKLGREPEAQKSFQRALEWEPEHAEALEELGRGPGGGVLRGLFGKGKKP